MRKKKNTYSEEFKLKVVKEYLGTDLSQKEITRKYNIYGHSCITRWMSIFGYKLKTNSQPKLQFAMQGKKEKIQVESELEEQLRKVKEALEYEQLRNEALTTMIDVAERELKISIRKKSGAKQ